MKSEKIKYSVLMSFALTLMPVFVYANIVWPSLIIVEGIMSWYIILFGIIIEFLFIKFWAKEGTLRAMVMTFGMNTVSALIGLILIPVSGFIAAIVLGIISTINTFDYLIWMVSYILAVLSNVLIEGYFLKLIFKKPFKTSFKWLLVSNSLSVIVAIAVLGFTMKKLY